MADTAGRTRDPESFRHRDRSVDTLSLVRGAALRASIELERAYPAPAESGYEAIEAARDAGGVWGLPIIGNVLDESMQVWMAWVTIYDAVRADVGEDRTLSTETLMRHEFLDYYIQVRKQLDKLAAGCLSGHPEIGPSWLGELHDVLVHGCGWSVAELVTHVMALHRETFPHCVKRDAQLVQHVDTYTQETAPVILGEG